MIAGQPDLAATRYLFPPDAKLLPVAELSARLRAKIGPVEDGQSIVTRPGFRVATQLVPGPLADLIGEFRTPSLLTDAVLRFARARGQEPIAVLDMAFDALATLVETRILVPQDAPEATAPTPTLGAGQEVAGFEIESLVRSLEDSEVYKTRGRDGAPAALKITRDDRPAVAAMFVNEARILDGLGGIDSPALIDRGSERGRVYVAMEWCEGVSIAVAAQRARASRDRLQLHGLVRRMLEAYGRLHARNVLHGDVHPGNCLVRDDGRVVILDFGSARLIHPVVTAVDPARAGIPQFHDPQMASALLAAQMPPSATPASEQFSIAVLAYFLLTGLHPVEAPAVQDEMLRRIVERPPLPFAARGVAAWPRVETVIQRALSKPPEERFPDVADFARDFASAGVPVAAQRRRPARAQRAFEAAVSATKRLAPSRQPARDHAWFALRAALALEDAELLAAAEVLVGRAGLSWAAQSVAAHVARARSDVRMESRAIAGFLATAEPLTDGPETASAILAAAGLLEGTTSRTAETIALAGWAAQRLRQLLLSTEQRDRVAAPPLIYAALSLVRAGVVPLPDHLRERVEAIRETQADAIWLWALAHDVFADVGFKALALAARLPQKPLEQTLSLLRLHQLTGEMHWIAAAKRVVARAPTARLPETGTALLMAELEAPERVVLPPFLAPVTVELNGQARRAARHRPDRRSSTGAS